MVIPEEELDLAAIYSLSEEVDLVMFSRTGERISSAVTLCHQPAYLPTSSTMCILYCTCWRVLQ